MNATTGSRHYTAGMVVLHHARVLLVHHHATGKLVFPGGHIDPNEAAHEAAVREVYEETGIHATVIPTGAGVDLPPGFDALPNPWMTVEIAAPAKPDRPGKPAEPAHRHIDLLFIGVPVDPHVTLRPALGEVSTAVWVSLGDLFGPARDRFDVRDEVPEVAYAAWQHAHRQTTTSGTGGAGTRSVVIGNLTAESVHFGTTVRRPR